MLSTRTESKIGFLKIKSCNVSIHQSMPAYLQPSSRKRCRNHRLSKSLPSSCLLGQGLTVQQRARPEGKDDGRPIWCQQSQTPIHPGLPIFRDGQVLDDPESTCRVSTLQTNLSLFHNVMNCRTHPLHFTQVLFRHERRFMDS